MLKLTKILAILAFLLTGFGQAQAFRALQLDPTHFANLGPVIPGGAEFCDDCASTTPCVGGGTGAWAFGLNSVWSCPFVSTVTSVPMIGDVTGTNDANLVKGTHYALTTVSDGTTPYTVLAADTFLAGNGSSGNVTANLPAALGDGKLYIFKNASATRTFTIHPSGTNTIEGVNADITLSLQYQTLAIVSTASGAWVEIQFPLNPVSSGGTGLSAGTSGGVPYFASASTMASSALLTNHGIVLGGGAGATPKTIAVGGTGSFPYGQAGADPIWSTLTLPNSATTGDLLDATSANAIGNLADVATGSVLVSGGVGIVPAWSAAPTFSGANITALNASNISSGSLATARGGSGVTYGAPQTSVLTAASGTYTTPSGATALDVCVYGPGGGGGAATSGGGAAEAGGGAGAGSVGCGMFTGANLDTSYTFTNFAGGTAGTCSGAPSAATNGAGNPAFVGSSDATNKVEGFLGNGGATASTVAGGAAGTGGSVFGTTPSSARTGQIYYTLAGAGGLTGVGAGDVVVPGGRGGGGRGGKAATVTSGGVCSKASTNGDASWIVVRAYFN